jgi:hypothetical protein
MEPEIPLRFLEAEEEISEAAADAAVVVVVVVVAVGEVQVPNRHLKFIHLSAVCIHLSAVCLHLPAVFKTSI